MKILTEMPPLAKKGELVSLDFETFGQPEGKLHRPTGTFACISVALERDPEMVYQLFDSHDLRKLTKIANPGTWVFHNALYDLRQYLRFDNLRPRYVHDIMLVDQGMQGGLYQTFSLADLTRRWLGEHLEKSERKEFSTATEMTPAMKKYAALDARNTLLIARMQLDTYAQEPRWKVYTQVDEPMIWPTLDMQGMRVDVGKWLEMVQGFTQKGHEIEDELDLNVYAYAKVKDYLKAKAHLNLPDTKDDTLAEYADIPVVARIREARMYRKASSSYGEKWLEENVEPDGKVYASYHITGSVDKGVSTGRMSCVSGDTLLHTSRGTFRMDEYLPQEGDLVPTHLGRWMPVVRKLFKGYEPMYRVELANGSAVQCTYKHQVLTPEGWKTVGDLRPGQEVISYVSVKELRREFGEREGSPAAVSGGRTQAGDCGSRQGVGDNLSERALDCSNTDRWSTPGPGAGSANVSLEVGRAQPYVGQEWFPTPPLQGAGGRWSWLPDASGERPLYDGAPANYGGSPGVGDPAVEYGCPSYRRGQAQQRPGQPGPGDQDGAWETAYEVTTITEIIPLGTMGVWDIEVAGDHSYLTQGYINHNCSDPNMQNIPQRKLPIYRTCFIASDGRLVSVWDVAQQEPCITAWHSQDRRLIEAIKNKEDLHLAVTRAIFHDNTIEKSDPRRSVGKAINLGSVYGLTKYGLMQKLKISDREAEKFLASYFAEFSGVYSWMQGQHSFAFREEYVETATGRRNYLNMYDRKWQNISINSPIQGGAADFQKTWVRATWEKEQSADIGHWNCGMVHDENIFDLPKELTRQHDKLVDEGLHETGDRLYRNIPFRADNEKGRSWAAKSMEEEMEVVDEIPF